MHIVAAVVVIVSFAPYAHATTAPCTIPTDLGWKIIGDANSAKACEATGTLLHDAECWVMPEGGYTLSATSYKCMNSALTVDGVTATIQVTGCKEHYRMSAGSSNADIVCTGCEPGKTIASMLVAARMQTCTADCDGATAGSCAMGCGVNFYQSSVTTSSDIKCTACNPGTISLAKPFQDNSDVCSACDGSDPGDCSTGCAAGFYQSESNETEITCTACSSGLYIAAMPVQSDVTSCYLTTTTTTTTTMNKNNTQACAVPSSATNPTMIATYVECLVSQCEDASTPWLEALQMTTARRLAAAPTTTTTPLPMVTCPYIVAVIQSNCSMMFGSALGSMMTNKSLDADIAKAVESFTVSSVCGSSCGNKCSDGASNPSGTTGETTTGSALVSAAPTKGPSIPFLTLAPTALLLSIMCL